MNDRTACQAEFDKWLENKKIGAAKRKANKAYEDQIVTAMQESLASIDSGTFDITCKLNFPVGELKEVTLKPRLKHKEMRPAIAAGPEERVAMLIAVASGENSLVIEELDSSDFDLLAAVVAYFL